MNLPMKQLLVGFPKNIKFCFAYGSGAFKQKTSDPSKNMLDLIFVVNNSSKWHAENMLMNPHHYAQPLRLFGSNIISKFQETCGAKLYYNTLIKTNDNRLIKYGVVTEVDIVEDLLDWNFMYLAGRLHKPVEILIEPDDNSQLRTALVQNLQSAVHAALLLLPENFTELDFYKKITGLSYNGDFRMKFGEDKSKIDNIVAPQIVNFRDTYSSILKNFDNYIEIPKRNDPTIMCRQDTSPIAKIFHLNQLPRVPQIELVRMWKHDSRFKDAEDCLRVIAHDPECSAILQNVFEKIVWKSSVSQSLKGIATAGIGKSLKYSADKIIKMIKSKNNIKKISDSKNDDEKSFINHVNKKNQNEEKIN